MFTVCITGLDEIGYKKVLDSKIPVEFCEYNLTGEVRLFNVLMLIRKDMTFSLYTLAEDSGIVRLAIGDTAVYLHQNEFIDVNIS